MTYTPKHTTAEYLAVEWLLKEISSTDKEQ